MATTNPVTQVLVSSGNQALLAAGNTPDALQHGQIGIFNFHTGLSINGSVPADARDIYIAVGINRTAGTGAAEDVRFSAGQMIQVRNAKALTIRGTATLQNKQQVVSAPAVVKCGRDFSLKFDLQSPEIYAMQGYNGFQKTFSAVSPACLDCDDCADITVPEWNQVALNLVNQINADPDNVLSAELYNVAGAAIVEEADLATFEGLNPTIKLGFLISAETLPRPVGGDINLKYTNTGTNFQTIPLDGLAGVTVTTLTPLRLGEGQGYDLEQDEYMAAGQNGAPGPYRQSAITGFARAGYESLIVTGVNYTTFNLEYDQFSVGGWLEYLNNLRTIIAIPCADTATLASLVGVTDLIFTQFGAMTNDIATMDCESVTTNTLLPATDGIESLS